MNNKNFDKIKNQKIYSLNPFLTLILLLSLFFFSSIAFTTPNSITLQGKLTNLAGALGGSRK